MGEPQRVLRVDSQSWRDGTLWSVVMAIESDWPGLIDRIEIHETATIAVEQTDDEITVALSGVFNVHFELTADQALKLSRALAAAAENAAKFLCANR